MALEELAGLWTQYVEAFRSRAQANPHQRNLYLTKSDGSDELVRWDEDGVVWLCERTADQVSQNVQMLADLDRCTVLLKAALSMLSDGERCPFLYPEAVDAVRAHLAGVDVDVPDVDFGERYTMTES
ncbi:hypothetical protein [Streptomyces sp. NPDC054838]